MIDDPRTDSNTGNWAFLLASLGFWAIHMSILHVHEHAWVAGDFVHLAPINIYLRLRLTWMHHEWTSKKITDLQVPTCVNRVDRYVDLEGSDASDVYAVQNICLNAQTGFVAWWDWSGLAGFRFWFWPRGIVGWLSGLTRQWTRFTQSMHVK